MSNLNLGGFDVVIHLAESVINRGLELLPGGSTFPIQKRGNITLTALNVPISAVGSRNVPLVYDAFLEFERPQITLNQTTGRVGVVCELSPASQLTFLHAANAVDTSLLTGAVPQIPLGGSIQLDCPFGVADISTMWGSMPVAGRAAVARAAGVNGTITLTTPAGNVRVATSVISAAAITIPAGDIRTALQTAFTNVGDSIGDLPLTNPVRLNSGPRPVQTVRDVVARISPAGSPVAISLGVLTGVEPASPGGTIPGPPADLNTLGALVWVSNYWTLHLLTTALNTAHPGMSFSVNRDPVSATFTGAVTLPGGDEPITVDRMSIGVNPGGGLLIDGHATAAGGCWTASIDFDFVFTFTCDPATGAVVAGSSVPNVTIDTHKDIWCIILGIIVGAIGGFIVGAIIGAIAGGGWGALIGGIIGAVVGGIVGGIAADALIDPLALEGVSLDSLSVLGGLTLPLPVGAAGFLVENCDFDDLAVGGRLVYVDLAERHRSGSVQFAGGAGFDLDLGVVRPALTGVSDDTADLVWYGTRLRTLPGAVIGPVFGVGSDAFDTLSLTDLEGFSYTGNSVQVTSSGWVPFAVRTDEARYAKCRARRESSGNVTLEYVVYARPPLCLGSLVTLETLSQTVVSSGTQICTDVRPQPVLVPDLVIGKQQVLTLNPAALELVRRGGVKLAPQSPPQATCGEHTTVELIQEQWQIVDRKQKATIQALPGGLSAPIKYRWEVFGTRIGGTGRTMVGSVEVTHDEASPLLTLVAPEGVNLVGSIVIIATDADCRKLRATRHINSPSRRRLGGCCGETKPPSKLTLIDAAQALDYARAAQRVYDAGITRLETIASRGQVVDVEPVVLSEAIARVRQRKAPVRRRSAQQPKTRRR
ncbi:MAG TPA: hypothetical protein VNM67_22840 [Thermoanaerobaculia bacterium]|jgi:outer membrane lipoprotein SlyB|nr:hypothetical protein [Thermoanaerobaculia bacterium]